MLRLRRRGSGLCISCFEGDDRVNDLSIGLEERHRLELVFRRWFTVLHG